MLSDRQRALMPPRVLPWLYFAVGHVSLVLAFGTIAWNPRAAAGFYYHAHLAGIVHLVTLGWITASILGALYVVGPVALRTPMPARWTDGAAFASVTIGLVGMVAHFWIEQFSGMAWSGMMVAAGILGVGVRTLRGLRRAPIPGAIKLHVYLAFLNIAVAATAGVLLGFDKVYRFLPGFVLANVAAHAHLAAIGWAGMMVVGIGYRLLPMVLPARMPGGPSLYLSAILLETGALGLFVTLMLRSAWSLAFVAATAAGFAVFAGHAAAMLGRRLRQPPGLPAVDQASRHAVLALASLAVSVALGAVLATLQTSPLTLRLALAYGAFGLLGFLAQMVVGMQVRLLPVLAWFTAAHRAPAPDAIPPMAVLSAQPAAGFVWLAWLWGVPAVAAGFSLDAIPLLCAGATVLAAATAAAAARAVRLAAHAFGRPPRISCGHHGAGRRGVPAQESAVQAARS